MSGRISIALVIVCVVTIVALSAAWIARAQTTNVPAGFQTPLVRDMELVNGLQALTGRVEALESKVKDLEDKLAKVKN
jgi:hypothetical protein